MSFLIAALAGDSASRENGTEETSERQEKK